MAAAGWPRAAVAAAGRPWDGPRDRLSYGGAVMDQGVDSGLWSGGFQRGKTNKGRKGLVKTLLAKLVACVAVSVTTSKRGVAAALNPLCGVGCRWLQAADGEPDRRSHPRHRHQPAERVPGHVPIPPGQRRPMFREPQPSPLHLAGELCGGLFKPLV